MGKSGKFGILFRLLPLFCALNVAPAAAYQDNPYLSCGLGSGFADYAESLTEREAILMKKISTETAQLPALEKSKSRFEIAGKIVSAAEFSLISLGINGLVFSSVSASFGAAQTGLQLRQAINATVGSASLAWAAIAGSPYGALGTTRPGGAQRIKGEIEQDVEDKDYQKAKTDLVRDEVIYNNADIDIRMGEVEAHRQHIDNYGVTSFVNASNEPTSLYGIPTYEGLRLDYHILKMANPLHPGFQSKAESKQIQIAGIQNHVDLYMYELDFLEDQLGHVISRCERHLGKLGKNPELSPEAIVDAAFKRGMELQSESQSGRAPAAANPGQ